MAKEIFKSWLKNKVEWIIGISALFIFGVSAYGLTYLPIIDFYLIK